MQKSTRLTGLKCRGKKDEDVWIVTEERIKMCQWPVPLLQFTLKIKIGVFGHVEARKLLPAETHKKIGRLSEGF